MYKKEFNCISICKVKYNSYIDKNDLRRCLDIRDGEIINVNIDLNEEKKYENRDQIVRIDGPEEEGLFGVWEWKAVENLNCSSKDYVKSKYRKDVQPIVIKEREEKDFNSLVNALKNGFEETFFFKKNLFIFYEKGEMYGLYLDVTKLTKNANKYYIPSTEMFVSCYKIGNEDIICSKDESFYRFIYLDSDREEKRKIGNRNLLIRSIIFDHSGWKANADFMGRRESQRYQEALKSIPVIDIYEEYADKTGCSIEKAEEDVSKHLENLNEYISGNDIPTKVVKSIASRDDELTEAFKKIIIEEKKSEIEQNEKKLSKTIEKRESELSRIEHSLEEKEGCIGNISKEIDSLNNIRDNISEEIWEKIEDGKENISKFLSEVLFLSQIIDNKNLETDYADSDVKTYYTEGYSSKYATEKYIESDEDLIKELADIFIESGINQGYSFNLALCLFASYFNNIPLILAGPSGERIANIFSMAFFGRTADIFDCSREYDFEVEKLICENRVVVMKNPFNSEWAEHIPELISRKSSLFILTTPFAEELLLEPVSWMNYAIPLLTEIFVDEIGYTAKYTVFKKKENYIPLTCMNLKENRDYSRKIESLYVSKICRKRISGIMNLRDILKGFESSNDVKDILMFLLPCAYLGNTGDEFKDIISHNDKMSSDKDIRFYTKYYFRD